MNIGHFLLSREASVTAQSSFDISSAAQQPIGSHQLKIFKGLAKAIKIIHRSSINNTESADLQMKTYILDVQKCGYNIDSIIQFFPVEIRSGVQDGGWRETTALIKSTDSNWGGTDKRQAS